LGKEIEGRIKQKKIGQLFGKMHRRIV
jgi:hypothetical protein